MQLTARRPVLVLGTMIALIAPIYGCDNSVAPEPHTPGSTFSVDPALQPRVVGDRLAFRDMGHVEGYLKAISEADEAGLANTEAQVGAYRSLRAYLDPEEWTEASAKAAEGDAASKNAAAALEKDGVVRGDFPVGDPFLSILNARGEVQIENTVFKVTRDHVYEVKAGEEALFGQVPTLSSPAPSEADPRLIVHPVETTEVRDGAVSSERGDRLAASMLGACHAYAGSNYRMRGTTSINNYFIYAEARVTTQWQRKQGWWIFSWWGNSWQSGTLAHEYWGNLYYGVGGSLFGPYPVSSGQSGTGTAQVTTAPLWVAGWGVYVTGSLNARHRVSNSQLNATCNT